MLNFIFSWLMFAQFSTHTYTYMPSAHVLAVKTMSLDNRYPEQSVNKIFKENILLATAYMRGEKRTGAIDSNSIDKPFHYEITLHKGEVFAFHDDVLPQYSGKVVATTHAHFNGKEGFKSDGYLTGDGVCHLASLIDFTAQSAGLNVFAPTSHDFANIPDVPKEYGVGIYSVPSEPMVNAQHNLYVTNTLSQDIKMVFDYHNSMLKVSIVKQT